MDECCEDRGIFGFGGWEWIIIVALVVIIFFPGIFSPREKCIEKHERCD